MLVVDAELAMSLLNLLMLSTWIVSDWWRTSGWRWWRDRKLRRAFPRARVVRR